jgi:phospholipid-binding lipoprotein MlaA
MTTHRRLLGSWKTLALFLAAVTVILFSPWTARAEEKQMASGASEGLVAYVMNEAQPSMAAEESEGELDPWEGFNEPMFRFNKDVLDRFLVKPLGGAWDALLPDPVQKGVKNAIENLGFVPRFANNLFQLKWAGAGREAARFGLNSTLGFMGFIDVAKDGLGIQTTDEDFGQTLGLWGAKQGPYLILPFVPPPLTIRDGVGRVVDAAMNPLTWVLPGAATWGILGTYVINERSLNLDRYERVEESVVDLYSAVRNAYLQRRAAAVRE